MSHDGECWKPPADSDMNHDKDVLISVYNIKIVNIYHKFELLMTILFQRIENV